METMRRGKSLSLLLLLLIRRPEGSRRLPGGNPWGTTNWQRNRNVGFIEMVAVYLVMVEDTKDFEDVKS